MAAFSPVASTPIAAPVLGTQGTAFINEVASATDAPNGGLTAIGAMAESATATEAILEFEIIAESASASDAQSCALIRVGALTERGGAREAVLNAIATFVTSAIVEACSASDLVRLPVWSDNTDDDQTWLPNTQSDSVWTNRSHAESTWTEN